MRGVAAGGMVTALEELGLRDAFDSVHGSSAGAIAGSYFVARQAAVGTSIYYEDINNRQFIDACRPFRNKPIMDVRYLVDYVMTTLKPLDFDLVIHGDIPVYVVMSDVNLLATYVRHTFDDPDDFKTCLRATVTMPFIGGSPIWHRDRLLYDGGLLQQVAIKSAINAGASHLLVLMTRRQDEAIRPVGRLRQRIETLGLRVLYGRNVAELYKNRNTLINKDIHFLLDQQAQRQKHLEILPAFLTKEMDYLHRLTTEESLLRRGAHDGARLIYNLFG